MPPVGFEPTISAGEQPQTYALDRAATGTGLCEELGKKLGHFEVPDCMFSSHVGLSIQDSQIYCIIESIILSA